MNPSPEKLPFAPAAPTRPTRSEPSGLPPPAEGSRLLDKRVRHAERQSIDARRQAAGFQPAYTAPSSDPELADSGEIDGAVGLALSGGGIRSASFNLGLLQAFYRSGLLRYVDYLSTVSGGSYTGAWLSRHISQLKDVAVNPNNLPLGQHPEMRAVPAEPERRQHED